MTTRCGATATKSNSVLNLCAGTDCSEACFASSKLREAVADGPVLFGGIENVHEHVLRADARAFAEQFRDAPEQRLFCSTVRVLNTVIWMYTTSALRATP